MKKGLMLICMILMVLGVAACGSSSSSKKDSDDDNNRSYQSLLKEFAKGYEEGNIDKVVKTMPKFMREKAKESYGDNFNEYMVEYYGKDFKLTFNVTGTKEMDKEWIEENQEYIDEEYEGNHKINKCLELKGKYTIKGSEGEDTKELEDFWYCDIDGEWSLVVD